MLWYVRNKNKVIGPFPAGQIQQSVLLGRISAVAEVSQDREEWKPLRQCPQLIPEVMKNDAIDEHERERLAAARRWADERRRERRAGEDDPERKGPGRRNQESYRTLEYRDHREAIVQSLQPSREKAFLVTLFVIILLAAGVYAGFHWVPKPPATPQCDAKPAPGINWHLCNKAGVHLLKTDLSKASLNSSNLQGANLFGSVFVRADLSYADLSSSNLSFTDFQQARLKGANLRAADLSKANFSGADLSYADLQDARLADT
ncbi:MAG: pentapeptide repeat-containing protein, partial [Gammaproteobacteria bacterium]